MTQLQCVTLNSLPDMWMSHIVKDVKVQGLFIEIYEILVTIKKCFHGEGV